MLRRFSPAANSCDVDVSSPHLPVSAPAIGKLRAVTGLVTIKRAETVAQASTGDSVYPDDVIETGADGSVTVVFVDGNAFYLRPGTVMTLDKFVFRPGKSSNSALFRILKGAFAVIAMQNYLAPFGQWVLVIQGVIFVICVLVFRRGIVGEIANMLRVQL